MKKIIVFAAALLIGVGAASAQAPTTDTTKNPSKSTQQKSQSSSDQMTKDKTADNRMDAGKNGDRTLIQTADVPVSLRQSLRGSDYTGWENGRVYKTRNGEYLVEINNQGTKKTHRFDANGKPIKE